MGCAASLIISIAVLSSVPPVSRDALVHHLAVPNLWLKHGGIYEMPDKVFSYYPMNLDLLYMIPLYFGNDILPKFIHFAFGLATAWLIYGYLKRRQNKRYGMLGALVFLSTPVIVKLSITVLLGIAGRQRSLIHAAQTGRVLSAIDPEYVGALSLMLIPGTPLFDDHQAGNFPLLASIIDFMASV